MSLYTITAVDDDEIKCGATKKTHKNNTFVNLENLQMYYLETLPVMREQFLASVIEGRVNKETFLEECNKLSMNFQYKYLSISIIEIDSINNKENYINLDDIEKYTTNLRIKKILDNQIKKYCRRMSFIYYNKLIVIALFNKRDKINIFIEGLNNFNRFCKTKLGINISIGVGNIVGDVNDLNISYSSSKEALKYKFLFGSGKITYIKNIKIDKCVELKFTEEDERKLLDTIKIADKNHIEKVIRDLFRKTEGIILEIYKYKIYLLEISVAIFKLIEDYNLSMNEIYGEYYNPYKTIDKFNSLDIAEKWVRDIAIKINLQIKKERMNSSKLLVEKAKQYIKSNYTDYDLSVEKLCDYLHVSPTYFSTIFKKETNMNFVNYLTSIRLEQALKLLKTTDDKAYIIAEKVGYQEANYFSYVFKRKYGITPSKYRRY